MAHRISIFSCDDAMVFSSRVHPLVPGELVPGGMRDAVMEDSAQVMKTSVLNFSLTVAVAGAGALEHILNSDIFMHAWRQLHEDGRFMLHDWTVKADPDTVFFADRVRSHLKPLDEGSLMYIRNCHLGFGFYGAFEVVSRNTVQAYVLGESLCRSKIDFAKVGEDLFMKECFDLLAVREVALLDILEDAYCAGHPYPCKTGRAAFHPFKAALDFVQCARDAMA